LLPKTGKRLLFDQYPFSKQVVYILIFRLLPADYIT